jgi:hypothetical protein
MSRDRGIGWVDEERGLRWREGWEWGREMQGGKRFRRDRIGRVE